MCLCRPAVTHYGMWDQLRVDHGKEFYLCLYMQQMLSEYRHNQQRQPYLQTQSTRVMSTICIYITPLVKSNLNEKYIKRSN